VPLRTGRPLPRRRREREQPLLELGRVPGHAPRIDEHRHGDHETLDGLYHPEPGLVKSTLDVAHPPAPPDGTGGRCYPPVIDDPIREPMTTKLDRELDTFEKHRAELLGNAKEKFVLIKGDDVVGVFESPADALQRGYEQYGNEPFLVKQVLDVDVPQNYTSFQVAL
jgi:hypothetical protein